MGAWRNLVAVSVLETDDINRESSSLSASTKNADLAERLNASDCKSDSYRIRWFKSISQHQRDPQGCGVNNIMVSKAIAKGN